jgi:hypothetical protein
MSLVVNYFGGPGCGKSTTSARLFSSLKMENINCELLTEFAKDLTWEENWNALSVGQIYVTARQLYKQELLERKVDVVVTDSPIVLGLCYYREENQSINESFRSLIINTFKQKNNLNFFLSRKKKYNPVGRNQTEEESKEIDEAIKSILDDNNIDYLTVDFDDDFDLMLDTVKCKLGN